MADNKIKSLTVLGKANELKSNLSVKQRYAAVLVEYLTKKKFGHVAHIQSINFENGVQAQVMCDGRLYAVTIGKDHTFNISAVKEVAGRQFSRRSIKTELCKLLRLKAEDGSPLYPVALTKKEILDNIKFVKRFAHQAGQMLVLEVFGKKVQFKEFAEGGYHFKNQEYVSDRIREMLVENVLIPQAV